MFDIGFAELFLLSIIGLLVLGPERLPAVARTLGGLARKARTSWYQLRRTIESELDAADVSKTIKSAQQEFKSAQDDFKNVSRKVSETVSDPLAAATDSLNKSAADPDNSSEETAADDVAKTGETKDEPSEKTET